MSTVANRLTSNKFSTKQKYIFRYNKNAVFVDTILSNLKNRENITVTTATANCALQCIILINGDAMQEAITERELNDYLKIAKEASKKGIDALSIVEVEGGKFNLVLDLTYKGKGIVLHTARKEPRGWPKLDSLVTYIKSLGFPEAPISMKLLRETNENSPRTDQNP